MINEFSNVALRKFSHGFTHEELKFYFLKIFKPLYSISWSSELFLKSLEISSNTNYSLLDSLILSAAVISECECIFTEDLSDGQKIEGVKVINPF